ncbi:MULTISPECIES: GtrA family protein [unclassified Oceanispirochaeta]|uniref:GtrA family protein n=1 Tax=unclassified Oceanispirochaeta TaxID=2635722 RepID=UPI000E09D2B2|nr:MULTISPECIES: GtrA family protein [unclassified Oceanispirochaeta]MBF9017541.1 GtrA family protein [Oceanispirochaeta sp. M2]NPD74113.1 GtrA family protein [Oceanispirochaeta sp. M1]RDG30035.1 GtrA family protein [Oceanispirochaeta sp. M1]
MSSDQKLLKKLFAYDIVRYTTVGIANTLVIFGLFFLCNELLGAGAIWSNRVGYAGGLISNFTLNKHWTFKTHKYNFLEIVLFLISFAVSYIVQFLIFRLLMDSLGWRDGVSALLAYPLYGLIFYFLCKYMVFTARADAQA